MYRTKFSISPLQMALGALLTIRDISIYLLKTQTKKCGNILVSFYPSFNPYNHSIHEFNPFTRILPLKYFFN